MRISDWSSDVCSSDLLARDNHNAPLIRAGEIVVADQGGPQWGGWLPTEGGLFVIEYRGGLNDYPDQRYPRVSHDIVQTFRDHKGRWWAGGLRKGVVGNAFYAACGPYRDECHLSDQLIGRVRSEEHTSELQSLMRISYAVFCLKKK